MRMIDADALIDLINRAEIRYDINGDPPQETREQIIAHAWGMYKVIMEEMIYNQPTLTPPNDPLTPDQLREMGEEPVYLVSLRYGISEWNILNGMDEIVLAYDEPVVGMKTVVPGIKFINGRVLWVGSYGEDWLAYRRPPEGET